MLFPSKAQAQAVAPPRMDEKTARYHAILLKNPKPGALFERFASAWLETGTTESLRAFLESRASNTKAATADRLILGLFFSRENQHQEASAAFARALASDAGNTDAWLRKAQAESRMMDFARALESLGKMPASSAGDTVLEAAKLRARLLARTGKTDEALGVLKTLATSRPDDADLQDEVVDLHCDEGLHAEAIEFLEALLARTPDPYQRVLRRLRLGDILQRLDKRDAALATYSACLDDAGQDSWVESEVLAQIEQAHRRRDNISGLKDYLATLALKHPQRLALGLQRCRVLIEQGEGEAALAIFRDLLAKNPGSALLRESFVDALAKLEKWDEAVAQMREIAARAPADKEARIRLATLLQRTKNPEYGELELDRLIEPRDTSEADLLRVARLFEGFGDPPKARGIFLRAADAFPESTAAQEAFASFLHGHDEKDRAVMIWRRLAAKGAREDVLRVARALAGRGEHEVALEVMQSREKEMTGDPAAAAMKITLAVAAKRPDLASGWVRSLIEGAKTTTALDEALQLARSVYRDAKLAVSVRKELQALAQPSAAQRCLLAELLETAGDPAGADAALSAAPPADQKLTLRLQARLFSLRQDWERAAGALEKLASSGGIGRAELAERIVGLRLRLGDHKGALAWIAEWKALMPGSTRAWLDHARVLAIAGKPDEAVSILRQATRKFEKDAAVLTALAAAHQNAGQLADTQRIYQQLYDEAEDAPSQLRWAGALAGVARQRAMLPDLIESFKERQRMNRQSVAPWLAIAEIHRITGNYAARRDAMLEAARLRPKDISLLHQIARIEEDEGDWRQAISTLRSAASLDKSDKTRLRIAEVHLRNGDDAAGLRIAHEIAGGDKMDARATENLALAAMKRGSWGTAEEFLKATLGREPDDYRLRMLRAICLAEEGRLEDALSELIALTNATVELKGVTPATREVPAGLFLAGQPGSGDSDTEFIRRVLSPGYQMIRYRDALRTLSAGTAIFSYVPAASASPNSHYGFIPPEVTQVPAMAAALMIVLAQEMESGARTKLQERLRAAGLPVPEVLELLEPLQSSFEFVLTEVKRHIARPGVAEAWMERTSYTTQRINDAAAGEAKAILRLVREQFREKKPELAVMAALRLWRLGEPDGSSLVDEAVALSRGMKDDRIRHAFVSGAMFQSRGLSFEKRRSPEARKIRDVIAASIRSLRERLQREGIFDSFEMLDAIIADWPAYVAGLEEHLARWRKKPALATSYRFTSSGNAQIRPVTSDQALAAIDSLPRQLLYSLPEPRSDAWSFLAPDAGTEGDAEKSALIAATGKIGDPLLKALLLSRCGDAGPLQELAESESAKPKPPLWALLFTAARATDAGDPAAAAKALARAHDMPKEQDQRELVAGALLHAISQLKAGQKQAEITSLSAPAKSAALYLRYAMASGGSYQQEQLAAAMDDLGMRDEAARIRKAVAAASVGSSAMSRVYSSSSRRMDADQLERDIKAGKSATAIPQAARAIRDLASDLAASSGSSSPYYLRDWRDFSKKNPSAAAEIWKQLPATEPSTHRQKVERAIRCELLNREDEAMKLYQETLAVKPRDLLVNRQLILLLAARDAEPQAILERIKAVDARDRESLGSDLFTNDYEMPLEPRLRLAKAIIAWLREARIAGGAKAEADWCLRATDMLASSIYAADVQLPHLLDAIPPGRSNAPPELLAERRRVFDQLHEAMMPFPLLASHVLSVKIALDLIEKGSADGYAKLARETLAAHAATPAAQRTWRPEIGWDEPLSGNSTSDTQRPPSLPRYLLEQAIRSKNEAAFGDDVIRDLRAICGSSSDSAEQFALWKKLGFCPEPEFPAEAERYRARRGPRGGDYQSQFGHIFNLWEMRGLTCDLSQLAAADMQAFLSRNSYYDCTTIARAIAAQATRSQDSARSFFIKAMEAALGEPVVGWAEFARQHGTKPPASRGSHSSSGNTPAARLERSASLLGAVCRQSIHGFAIGASLGVEHGFDQIFEFSSAFRATASKHLPADARALVAALEGTRIFGDMRGFDTLGAKVERFSTGYLSLADSVTTKGAAYAKAVSEEIERLQKEKPLFGRQIFLATLNRDTAQIEKTLLPFAAELTALDAARQAAIIAELKRCHQGSFDAFIAKASSDPALAAFRDLATSIRAGASARILQAKAMKDIDPSPTGFQERVAEAAAAQAQVNLDLAEKIIRHAAQLIARDQAGGSWTGRAYTNGFNVPSSLLMDVSAKMKESLKSGNTARFPGRILALQGRLVCAPDQRLFVTNQINDLGPGLLRAWESAGGPGDPRGAFRAMIADLAPHLDARSSMLTVSAFFGMCDLMDRHHRAVLAREAEASAAKGGTEGALAAEFLTGLALLEMSQSAGEGGGVADFIKRIAPVERIVARLRSPEVNPIAKARLSRLLPGRLGRALDPDALRACVETIFPLLEEDMPGENFIWTDLLRALRRLPAGEERTKLDQRLCKAWLKRARFNSASPSASSRAHFMTFTGDTATATEALEIFARSGSDEELERFWLLCGERQVAPGLAPACLARHGRAAMLQRAVTAFASKSQSGSYGSFEVGDEALLPKIESAASDPAAGLLACIRFAGCQNASEKVSTTPEGRLKAAAAAFLKLRDRCTPAQKNEAVRLLCNSLDAARLLAPAFLPETKLREEIESRARDSGRDIRVPVALALAALANGDPKPWQELTGALASLPASVSDSNREDVIRAFSDHLTSLSRPVLLNDPRGSLGWFDAAMKAYLDAWQIKNGRLGFAQRSTDLLLGTHFAMKKMDPAHQPPVGLLEAAISRLHPYSVGWFLDDMGRALAQAPPGDSASRFEHLKSLLVSPLTGLAVKSNHHIYATAGLLEWFSQADLRAHTAALARLAPMHRGITAALVRAWAWESDAQPLVNALSECLPEKLEDFTQTEGLLAAAVFLIEQGATPAAKKALEKISDGGPKTYQWLKQNAQAAEKTLERKL